METREELKSALEAEYKRWYELINQITEDQWKLVLEGYNWTLKDVLAHLLSWMQVSNARLSAALMDDDPQYPNWLQGGDPDTESDELTNAYNARIFETYHNIPREVVIDSWRDNFLTLIKIMDDLSDEALFTSGSFSWLPDYAMKDVLQGSLGHHNEHFEGLIKFLLNS